MLTQHDSVREDRLAAGRVSFQLLDERGEHAFQFGGLLGQLHVVLVPNQLPGRQKMVFELARRSHRNGTEATELGISIPAES